MAIGAHKYLPSEGRELLSTPSASPAETDPNHHTVLDREALFHQPSPLQSEVDEMVDGFAQKTTDWKSLFALTTGSLAFRLSRLGCLHSMQFLSEASSKILNPALRGASWVAALGTESTAFEATHRALHASTHGPHLLRWNGHDGLKEGLLTSLITFGSLKGAGAVVQGQNVLLQHLFQDTGMVLAHQVSGHLGLAPKPEGSLAKQYLQAEAINLQLQAGVALLHGIAPHLSSLEKALDLQLQSKISDKPFSLTGGLKAKWLALGLASAPMEGKYISPPVFPDRGRAAIQKNLMTSYGEGSISEGEQLKSRFRPFFPEDPQAYGAEILEDVLDIRPPFPHFHERFLEALARMPDRGSRQQYNCTNIIKEIFQFDALHLSTGSFEQARLQLLVSKMLEMESPDRRFFALETLFQTMETGMTPEKLDHLFSSFGVGNGWEISARAESRPIQFIRQEMAWTYPLSGGRARIFVDPEGEWFLQNLSDATHIWIMNQGRLESVEDQEIRPLVSGDQFAVGDDLRTAQGYTLEKNDSEMSFLRWGNIDPQLFSEIYNNAEKFQRMVEYHQEVVKSGQYDPEDLSRAFQFARNHPQGKLVLRRIANILATRDHPIKLQELRHEIREDSLETVLRLHGEGVNPREIARRLNGTHHTAYLDDIRVARKLVSVLLDVSPYLQDPQQAAERFDEIRKEYFTTVTWARVMGLNLDEVFQVSDLIELLEIGGDPQIERLKKDLASERFSLGFEEYEGELDDLLSRMKVYNSTGLALFLPAKKPGEKDRLILRRLPSLKLDSDQRVQEGFDEILMRLIAIPHEWDHSRHFSGLYEGIEAGGEKIDLLNFTMENRHDRFVSEILADLEMWRWQFKSDLSYWLNCRRMGVTLPLYLVAINDHGYFGQINRKSVRNLEKRLSETTNSEESPEPPPTRVNGRQHWQSFIKITLPTPLIPPPPAEPPPPPKPENVGPLQKVRKTISLWAARALSWRKRP
jgi:hypothetical protein